VKGPALHQWKNQATVQQVVGGPPIEVLPQAAAAQDAAATDEVHGNAQEATVLPPGVETPPGAPQWQATAEKELAAFVERELAECLEKGQEFLTREQACRAALSTCGKELEALQEL
jgi:hypothetical protein